MVYVVWDCSDDFGLAMKLHLWRSEIFLRFVLLVGIPIPMSFYRWPLIHRSYMLICSQRWRLFVFCSSGLVFFWSDSWRRFFVIMDSCVYWMVCTAQQEWINEWVSQSVDVDFEILQNFLLRDFSCTDKLRCGFSLLPSTFCFVSLLFVLKQWKLCCCTVTRVL